MRRDTGVGTEGNLDPAADGFGEALLGIAGGGAGLVILRHCERAALAVSERSGGGEQGRDVISAGLLVEAKALLIGEGAMLDRIDPGAECGVDAFDPVGMRRDLAAEGARGGHHGAHLVVHHLLIEPSGDIAEHPAGGGELDHVGAGADLLAGRAAAIVGAVAGIAGLHDQACKPAIGAVAAVAMSTRHRDHPRCRKDIRAGELTGVDRVAQGQDEPRIATEIAHRGETGEQGLAGVEDRGERLILIVAARCLEPRLEPVVEAGEMDVAVNQAGQHGRVAQVHDARAGEIDEGVADLGDGPAADDDSDVAARRLARFGNQRASVDYGDGFDCRLSESGSGGGERERDDQCLHDISLFRSCRVREARGRRDRRPTCH